MQRHRIRIKAYTLTGVPLDGFTVDTFTTRKVAEKITNEYRHAIRRDLGWLCWITSNITSTEWEKADA